ncbi:MAG: serine hydrolase, partial [Clostridia bacterium]|nr:serine hydrolase [Clostridia bacterium]
MFTKSSPESVGISSRQILKYLKIINSRGLASHSVLIARGDKLICEAYWKPFDRSVKHRMYSQTKSYVGIAVRLLADEGKISLDDKIFSYFPDKLPEKIHPYLEKLTIRNMLMMRTCFDEYDVS